jgi:hypothetical protein
MQMRHRGVSKSAAAGISIAILAAVGIGALGGGALGQNQGATVPAVPGGTLETVEPQATVISEAYYQVLLDGTCAGNGCQVTLPRVKASHQLILRSLSCILLASASAQPRAAVLQVRTPAPEIVAAQYVAPAFSWVNTGKQSNFIFNRETDLLISARRFAILFLNLNSGTAFGVQCTFIGTLQQLQP